MKFPTNKRHEAKMQPAEDQPFLLGVNYWPRRKAMYWWSFFDVEEVKEEFELIRSLELRLVRIFLLWEDWQPSPDSVNPDVLRHFESVCRIAEGLELQLDVTFFTGHMSGPNWIPSWMLRTERPLPSNVRQVVSRGNVHNCGYANPYSDPEVLNAEEILLQTVVSEFKDHPAIAIWNLGNEPDLVAQPPSARQGEEWVRRMTRVIKEIDPIHQVTLGLHSGSLEGHNGFRVDHVFTTVDLAVMHGYPIYTEWARGPLDDDLIPFLCALTTSLSGKPTLMEEFGACTHTRGRVSSVQEWVGYGRNYRVFMASEEDFARHLEEVLRKLVAVGATGAVLWCFADYAPELYIRPPCDEARHERFFGLVRSDGTLKPHAEVIQQFALTRPGVTPAKKKVTLGITPDEYYENPSQYIRQLYRSFANGQ